MVLLYIRRLDPGPSSAPCLGLIEDESRLDGWKVDLWRRKSILEESLIYAIVSTQAEFIRTGTTINADSRFMCAS